MSSSNDPKIDPIAEVGYGDLFRPRSPAVIQMEKDTVEQRVKESEALHIYQDFIDSTFMDLFGTSQVMIATPSAPSS